MGEGTDLLVGGYGTSGSFNVTAPMDKPCYISLINMRLNRLDVSVQGVNVQAQMVTLNFPFNSSVSKNMNTSTGAPSRINGVDQVTYIYLGSVVNKNSTS